MKLIALILLSILFFANCLIWIIAIITPLLLLPEKENQNAH